MQTVLRKIFQQKQAGRDDGYTLYVKIISTVSAKGWALSRARLNNRSQGIKWDYAKTRGIREWFEACAYAIR
jgi:hypothetical protein